jgi:hypothetical protein
VSYFFQVDLANVGFIYSLILDLPRICEAYKNKNMNMKINKPTDADKMEKQFSFRMSQSQYLIVQKKSAQAGRSVPEFLRHAAIYGEVKAIWSPSDRELFLKLAGMADEIHELAEKVKKEGLLPALSEFGKYERQIDGIMKQFNDNQIKNEKE